MRRVDRTPDEHLPTGDGPAEWADWDATARETADPRTYSLLIFESRSPEWVAEVGRLLSGGLRFPVWFVDAADTAWPAGRVDSDRVSLA